MHNSDDDSSFQYYTIKDEITIEDNFTNIDDVDDNLLSLPSVSDDNDNDNKPVFYLTFNNEDQEDKSDNSNGTLFEMANLASSEPPPLHYFNTTNVKLITLGDGRMFVTTDKDLETLQTENQLIIDAPPEEEEETSESVEAEDAVENSQLSPEEEEDSVDFADQAYEVVTLADGTQAIVKVYRPDNEKATEEKPKKKAKKYHCPHEGCKKIYTSTYHLRIHIRSHTNHKPYECTAEGCDKKFSTNYSLKAHTRIHTGEKPYPCPACEKQFKASGDLHKHIRTHTGEKPFECPIEGCGRSFTTSNIRKVHIRSHTGERPYICDYPDCGKSFTSITNHKNHIRIHSGEKPYVCKVESCRKRFTEYSSLYKHRSVHEVVHRYICGFCGQRCKHEAGLKFHKRLRHDILVTKDGTEIIVKMN